jgi:hypothetical protein
MDRKFFTDGALAINCSNLKLCKEIRQEISNNNKIKLLSDHEDDIIDNIRDLNIVIMFYGCDHIMKQKDEQQEFYGFLRKIAEQTQNIKVIFF